MYNSKFLKISIHLVYFSLLIFIGFIVISAMFYPGTTIRDHDTEGYNIFNNFLSDLGRTITHHCSISDNIGDTCIGGSNNFFSAFFFNNAMFICGIIFIIFYVALPGYFYDEQALYRLSIFGSVLGVTTCSFFAIVGLTPADLYFDLHVFFANNMFKIAFPTALIYSFVIYRSKLLSTLYGIGYFSFSILLILYVGVLEFGPSPTSSDFALIFQATTQKMIALAFVLSSLMLAKGIKRSFS